MVGVSFINYTACVSCVDYYTHGAYSASNGLLSFPHINNSRPRHGESSKGPKTPHPTNHHPVRSWLHTWRDRLQSPDIAPGCHPDIPRIAQDAPSYYILASPIPAGPDTEQGCASLRALSVRTGHRIRPDYEQHSRTVLCHIDMGRITLSMPYNYLPSENHKDSKMSHTLYTQLPHFSIFVRKFYFGPNFTHWYSLKISNLRIF